MFTPQLGIFLDKNAAVVFYFLCKHEGTTKKKARQYGTCNIGPLFIVYG